MRGKAPLILFIDGGGTSTKVWAENNRGRVERKTAFPSRFKTLPRQIKNFINKLSSQPVRASAGFRGTWTAAEKSALKKKFSFLRIPVKAMSDIELAHQRFFHGGAGLVLNAGTGSIAYGKNEKGKSARAGGFGPFLGDDGSAFWMGREILKARSQKTSQLLNVRKMVVKEDAVKRIAGLASIALKGRDAHSKRIVKNAQSHLKNLAENVQKQLKIKKPAPLALTGGLFQNKRFRKDFLKLMRGYTPVA